jgi:hypothetical protein
MSTTRPHGNDNSHSAIQIDPPQQQQQQPVVHSTTAATFLLPTHRPNYNDDDNDNDEDSGEDGPLLNDRTGGSNSGRQRREQRGVESTPFLYRLHDGLSDLSASKFLIFKFHGKKGVRLQKAHNFSTNIHDLLFVFFLI